MNCYRTIRETDDSVETLYEIQKSRFITHIRHVETEEEARSFIQAMKKQYFDARHNCSAYVLGERADKQKSNDDGEPGGTAGNPILEAIKKNELTDVVIVVTRYFGGIKLGAGGLIRAYGHAAVLGIEAATRIEMTEIAQDFAGDAHAPTPGPEWVESARSSHVAASGLPYHFVTLRRQG